MAFVKRLISSVLIFGLLIGIKPSDVVTVELINLDIIVQSCQEDEDLPHGW